MSNYNQPPPQPGSSLPGYEPPRPGFDQPRGNRGGGSKIGFVIAGVVIAVVLLCCGGIGGLAYFGLDVMTNEIELALRDHPTIQEHIGEVESFKMSFSKSIAASNDDVYYYELTGPKGSGELKVESVTGASGDEEILSATLRTPTGEEIELDLSAQ